VAVLRRRAGTRLFFAADLHGSEPTWRKFVNAAAFYDVDALVFGGDLMGKALVPIVRENGSMRAELHGRVHELESRSALEAFTRSVEVWGFYWRLMDADEYERHRSDPLLVEGTMQELARERLRAWAAFAEERLEGTSVRVFMTGGNDDSPAVLEVLDEVDGDRLVACEGRVVDVDDVHTMITVGLSTPTPWDTPREASEEEIRAAIEASVAAVPDVGRCVFNLHCPPKDTILDRCVKLDTDHVLPGELPRPVREAGRVVMIGGGSVAVRDAIRTYQPVVALHGHIHESPGRIRIGGSPCFNPGSEYAQGRLEGVVVQIRDARVTAYQHTSG
jgi:Icc-related predicted phosphoesterase